MMGVFAKRVKKAREDLGISIRTLATESGVSFSSIARAERGDGAYSSRSERALKVWLGDDVSGSISPQQERAAREIGIVIARAFQKEIIIILKG